MPAISSVIWKFLPILFMYFIQSHVATSRLLQLVFLFSYSAMQYLLGCAALQDEKEEKTVSKDFVKAG